MHKLKSRVALGTVFLTGLLCGCTMIPEYHRPAAPVSSTWPAGSAYDGQEPNGNGTVADLQWKQFFRDPVMQQLIAAGLENNRNLRIAQAQTDAASAQFDVENAALFPALNGMAGTTVSKQYSKILSIAPKPGSNFTRDYAVGFGVSAYEVDIWGRVRSALRAAFARYMGDAFDRQSVQISLMADISAAYMNWVADNQAVLLTENVLANWRKTYELVKATESVGSGTDLDVAQAESAVHQAETELQIYRRQRAQALNQLTLLVGAPLPSQMMSALESKSALKDVMPFPDVPAGLPSDLIARRPDILRAEANLQAANDDIGAARAEFFPKIQITAGNGTASNNITHLFESGMGAWNVAPQITMPLFDAGRLTAQFKIAKARKREEIARYEDTVQTAFKEVADALAGRGTYLEQLNAQDALIAASNRQYTLALARFQEGSDAYLNTLVAQRTYFDAELGGITTQLQRMTNFVTLYKTLGGGWSGSLTPRKAPVIEHIL